MLRRPAGQRARERKRLFGQAAFSPARRQGEGTNQIRRAGACGQVERLIDDMHGLAGHPDGIEQAGGPLPYDSRPKTGDALGARQMGNERGLQKSLKIDGEIVALGAHFPLGTRPGARLVAAKKNHPVDKTIPGKQRSPLRIDHPGDARLPGNCVSETQRRGAN